MIAAHQTMLAPQGGPSSLDYVQDGLYYQLDGIENAGRGVHDASASTWTDLTGNGRGASFINGKTWKDDACYLAGMTSDHMAKIAGLPSMTAFTFEIVHKLYSWELAGRVWDTEAYFGSVQGKRFYGFCDNTKLQMDINIANNTSLLFPEIPVNTTAKSITFVPTTYSTTVAPYVYMNGVFAATRHSSPAYTPQTTTFIDVANRSNSPNRGVDMDVYAIRVYNRVLSAAEIAANYAIDKARFNLP